MNTPAHLILGAAALARPGAWKRNLAVVIGSLAPDVSLYFLAAMALFVNDVPASIVFGQMYYSDEWQRIFAVDNSFLVWLALLLLAYLCRWRILTCFSLAGLLHLATDFPLHHDDGRPHFWPLSDWVFRSPVSYWDPAHYGNMVGMLEVILCAFLCIWLFRRFPNWTERIAITVVGLAEIAPNVLYRIL